MKVRIFNKTYHAHAHRSKLPYHICKVGAITCSSIPIHLCEEYGGSQVSDTKIFTL